jgi:hypothetical protein
MTVKRRGGLDSYCEDEAWGGDIGDWMERMGVDNARSIHILMPRFTSFYPQVSIVEIGQETAKWKEHRHGHEGQTNETRQLDCVCLSTPTFLKDLKIEKKQCCYRLG